MDEQTPPTSEPTPVETKNGPTKAATLTPEVVKPKKKLFGGDTRAGRALRSVIRTIAFVVGFYALGFFTAYLLLYRPLQNQYKAVNAQLTQVTQELEQKQSDLDKASLTFLGVQNQNKQLTDDLDKARGGAPVAGPGPKPVERQPAAVGETGGGTGRHALAVVRAGAQRHQPRHAPGPAGPRPPEQRVNVDRVQPVEIG